MAQPEWLSPAGSLGTIPEEVYFQYTLLATTPIVATVTCTATSSVTNRITCNTTADLYPGLDVVFGSNNNITFGGLSPLIRYFVLQVYSSTEFSITATESSTTPIALTTASGTMTADFRQHVMYNLQAGQLPSGMQVSDNGSIIGTPRAVASVQGVPTPVATDVTSKFTVRAYTKKYVNGVYVLDGIRDRTFTITVTGPNPPEFLTPAGQIAQCYDGILFSYQIQVYEPDPGQTATVKLVGGALPKGLSISPEGLISGAIIPLSPIGAEAGFSRDGQGFDEYSFDFSTLSVNSNYEFTLEVTDGVSSQLRTFSIYVYAKNSLSGTTSFITADDAFITADEDTARPPIIYNPQGSIGTTRNDNWFAYRFLGQDFDGDPYYFELVFDLGDSTTGLPGLTLDPITGWLYGFIPSLGLTENTYNFLVRIRKTNEPTIYNEYSYSLTIVGPIDTDIIWVTPSNLGIINNGDTSMLYVEAVNAAGLSLQYELVSGSASTLPQGLTLLPSGNIAGRVSFNTFAVDLGTTTFDVTLNDLSVSAIDTETTFDMKHTFLVRAFSVDGVVNVSKEFSITVNRAYNEPYDNLYIEAMPPEDDRVLISNLLQNTDIFRPELLYRPDDPNFGRSNGIVYRHAYGLTAATYSDYVSSLYENHYWKNLTLGEIKVAQARNALGEIVYEVVYSQVIDNMLNNEGQSVSKAVTLPYAVDQIKTVYPNSLINMRDQVIDTVGQVSNILPLWMTSKQANGKVLGFTPAVILAYAKPTKGDQIAYYIKTQFGQRLNLVDFEVDRYELDRLLSKNWDPIADSTGGAWVPTPAQTTFDIYSGYLYNTPSLSTTGRVLTSTTITSVGDPVFGFELLPDAGEIIVTVNGTIQTYNSAYTVNFGRLPNYVTFDQDSTPAAGSIVIIYQIEDISVSNSAASYDDQTVFDQNSMKFIAPVDMYSNSQEYDKYLVFPKRTILG